MNPQLLQISIGLSIYFSYKFYYSLSEIDQQYIENNKKDFTAFELNIYNKIKNKDLFIVINQEEYKTLNDYSVLLKKCIDASNFKEDLYSLLQN